MKFETVFIFTPQKSPETDKLVTDLREITAEEPTVLALDNLDGTYCVGTTKDKEIKFIVNDPNGGVKFVNWN